MKSIIIPREVLEKEFIKNNKNISKTAKELNYSVKVITRNLDDYKIERNKNNRNTNYLHRDRDWLYNEYCVLKTDINKIAIKCNTTTDVLYDWINKYNLPKRKIVFNITYDDLYFQYVESKKSTKEIGILYSVSSTTISSRLKKYDIPIRSASENQKIYANEKCKNDELSKLQKLVWEKEGYKEKMSNIHKQVHINNPSLKIIHSARMQGLSLYEWSGFVSNENSRIRKSEEYNNWRLEVLNKYSYKCLKCGNTNNLNVHHIENFSSNELLRFDINNGVVLCECCHLPKYKDSFHNLYGVKNNNLEQLLEFLIEVKKEE